MSKSAKRLGRGLNSLVPNLRAEHPDPTPAPDEGAPESQPSPPTEREPEAGVRAIMLRTVQLETNPFQPRSNITNEHILSLAESIRQAGVLQPLTVRPQDGGYEIIAGERRWRAAQAAGLTHVPVILRDATNDQMLEWALVENIQREDLNAIDRAKAYRELATRCSLRPDEVAERLGEDRTTVVNYLRLLELPKTIQQLVAARHLTMGHARCLLGIEDDADRMRLAESVARNELSVRALEEIVRREKTRKSAPTDSIPVKVRPRSPHIQDLQRRFEESLKTKVTIQEGKRKGSGRIVIEYFSLDDFDRVSEALGVSIDG